MRYPLSGEQGVAALVLLALLHEVFAEDQQLLSHAYDRWLTKHPILVWIITLVVVLHLLNVLPNRFDPFAKSATVKQSD